MTPPLGVFSGVHSKSAKSRVLGLWSPCTNRLCTSIWPSTDFSQVLFGSFAFIGGKKDNMRVCPMVGTTHPMVG